MDNTEIRTASRGDFEVLREIGHGGSAVVYCVREKASGNVYAMKTAKEGRGRILHDEAVLLSKARHSGIPAFYAELETRDGFVLEYVEGQSLLEVLSSGKIYEIGEAAEAGIQFCEILACLHRMDPPRIYRDLKPSNIIVKSDGTYSIVDYGAVRAFREGAAEDTHRLGTDGYAAPEQYGGWEQSDVRTDVYGIGAVLHSMVTGKPPQETGLCPIGELLYGAEAGGMEKVLLRCCSVSPSMRYASAEELKKALKRVQNSEIRRARRRRCEDQETVWKKFVMAAWLSLGCFLVSGMFAAAATGVRSAQYYRQIEMAAGTGNLWDKAAGFREAVQVMPLETEAYETFAEDIARDSVITAEESEAFCSLFYANDCMNRLREWKPGSYAKLQIKAGKLFWTYGGDEREAIRQFWANAASVRGASGHDRRTASAMCDVLSDVWTDRRASSWLFLEQESMEEALRRGDGNFAAAVCAAASGEAAVCADRYEAAGTDEETIREVTRNAQEMLNMAENGKCKVCGRLTDELREAVNAARNGIGQQMRQNTDSGSRRHGKYSIGSL